LHENLLNALAVTFRQRASGEANYDASLSGTDRDTGWLHGSW